MSISIQTESFPNELITQIAGLLDARSKVSFSAVCKRSREIIENMGLPLSMLGFSSYLTDELLASDLYSRALKSKNATECETFKSEVGIRWFEALSSKQIPEPLLEFAICHLSAERAWTDAKIKKLCQMFNYEAKKEMPHYPHSWKVFPKLSEERSIKSKIPPEPHFKTRQIEYALNLSFNLGDRRDFGPKSVKTLPSSKSPFLEGGGRKALECTELSFEPELHSVPKSLESLIKY